MTEADAIQAQTAMLQGRLDALTAEVAELNASVAPFVETFSALSDLLAQVAGQGFWLAYWAFGAVAAYVILRVIWAVTRRFV